MSVAIFKSTVPGPLSWIPQDFVQCSNPLNMADRDMTWTALKALFGDHLQTDHTPLTYDVEVKRVCGLNDSMTGCLSLNIIWYILYYKALVWYIVYYMADCIL